MTPEEVLFFVRSVDQKDHVTYNDFMELLCPPEDLSIPPPFFSLTFFGARQYSTAGRSVSMIVPAPRCCYRS